VSSRPKPREAHFGIAIGHVIAISVRIEEQIRRVHHPQTTVPAQHGVRHVQAIEHDFGFVESAIAIRVLVNRDDVAAMIVDAAARAGRDRIANDSICRG
jgi:hypothetical protein